MNNTARSLDLPYWVLIVEDDGMLADAYERIIDSAGGKPVSVGNGTEATKIMLAKNVDVVLLDIQMPGMDGLQLLSWMRENGVTRPLVVVLSNTDNQETIAKAYDLGADRYVLKAWATPNDLIKMLNESLAMRVLRNERKQTEK